MASQGTMMYSNINRTPAAYNMMYHNSMAGTASPLAQMAADLDISSLMKMEAHSNTEPTQAMARDAYLECMFGLAHTQQLNKTSTMLSSAAPASAHHMQHQQSRQTSYSVNPSRCTSPEPHYRMTAHSAHTSPVPFTAASPQLARHHTGSYGVATAAHYSPMSSCDASPVLASGSMDNISPATKRATACGERVILPAQPLPTHPDLNSNAWRRKRHRRSLQQLSRQQVCPFKQCGRRYEVCVQVNTRV